MLTFSQQEKILSLILKNPSNKQCADCNTISPTWASLNFGVFLCSNCSGAHRALGPTITRVKSTKLDQWNKQWVQNMRIGNKQINEYWQGSLGMTRKPKMGASQTQLFQYISTKYVKKKFVKDASEQDPLTQYKNGTYKQFQKQVKKQQNPQNKHKKQQDQRSNVAVQQQQKVLDLMQFQINQPNYQTQSQTYNSNNLNTPQKNNDGSRQTNNFELSANNQPMRNEQEDEFTQYTEVGTSFTGTSNNDNVSYDDLMIKNKRSSDSNEFKLPTLHHVHSAQLSYQNPYYGQIGHHNINILPQPIINNTTIMHNQIPQHNYSQSGNYHYNNLPQTYQSVYGISNMSQSNMNGYNPTYGVNQHNNLHHTQYHHQQSMPHNNGVSINNNSNIASLNLNLSDNKSTNSEKVIDDKNWIQGWK